MSYPFRQARHFYKGRQGRPILWLVVHTAETAEMGDSAEAVARYFATTDRPASAHLCGDNDSIVRCVLDKDTAFAAKSANSQGLHYEFAGRAAQTPAQWADTFSSAELVLGAQAFALWSREHNLPIRFVDAAGLKRGDPGITTHAEVEKAWPSSGHTDPGPHFPMAMFLDLVRAALGNRPIPTPTPIQQEDDDMSPEQTKQLTEVHEMLKLVVPSVAFTQSATANEVLPKLQQIAALAVGLKDDVAKARAAQAAGDGATVTEILDGLAARLES